MRVLLAIDGSSHSHAAIEAVAARDWPAGTEIAVLTVIHSKWPVVGDPVFIVASAHADSLREQQLDAPALLDDAVEYIRGRTTGVTVAAKTVEGVPHDVIVQEAEAWNADLIMLGSHGYGPIRRAILGSVAAAVAVEAPCAVEIIRMDRPPVASRRGARLAGGQSASAEQRGVSAAHLIPP